ncbi:hypothetical protein ALC62_15741 [Cyphomyrmex costatus]|uniref:Uncharacterized protein n=1 Tax=Cyphomyrmex costatus TaxID=456900 RepID=A0A151I6M3_9HYME|nr:hypothetical protein ALC62_15741 [Cyphomyrmex costatus]
MLNDFAFIPKEKSNWNVATHHLRKAIRFQCPREILWIKTLIALENRGKNYEAAATNWAFAVKLCGYLNEVEKMEDLLYCTTSIDTLEAYQAWEIKCVEYLDYLREVCRNTSQPISTGLINSSIAKIARLEYVRSTLRPRFVHEGSGHAESSKTGLSWMEIETAFNNRVLTVNLQRHACLKVNATFNGEFVADDKRSFKSITTKNHELYPEQKFWSGSDMGLIILP